ncbi:MAG TPA: hypothetical protein VF232_12595 [Gaiellaceae bacterium]
MTDFVRRYFTIEQSLRARISELDAHAPLPSNALLGEAIAESNRDGRCVEVSL